MSAASDDAWTIARVLAWAVADFKARGMETPRLDAELLLGHALGLDRIKLILQHERLLAAEELARYRALIKRRRAGEPVAYLLGVREFYGLPIRVDARALIPRPDTEALVDVALERTRARSLYGRALDLCTGSGCVALALASRRPTWKFLAVDASCGAVELARENVERLGMAFSVGVLEGDLFATLPTGARFELITANPPYIPEAELATLDPSIREFEPRLALTGGESGLELAARIVASARVWLTPGGLLAMELGSDQAERGRALFAEAGFIDIETRRDYGGRERVTSGVSP
ncbi:MAG: peptide chain release factor N(5)-glutamine methyltransferase [Sorangiineae bacterium]|nr:peptide chain release factor N(5)-glutamine methyltransferase [Polyangiaceae bacterium]MEB2322164.1 peptide chain release factor N(5)-glutamine methyltransferase [Sorangiineae bacterium]